MRHYPTPQGLNLNTHIKIYRISLKGLGIVCLALVSGTLTYSQNNTVIVQTRRVAPENIEEFVHRETTYWREVAKKAIEDGRLSGWDLWQRVDGFDLHEDHNFLFVNSYTPEQFDMEGNVWDFEKVFPRMKRKDVETFSISEVQDQLFYQNLFYVERSPPIYMRVNFADASNASQHARLELEIWGPFISGLMDIGKTKVVSWGCSRLIIPRGRDISHTGVSVDGFETLGDALGRSFDRDVDLPAGVDKIFEVHEKSEVHIYRIVATAASSE